MMPNADSTIGSSSSRRICTTANPMASPTAMPSTVATPNTANPCPAEPAVPATAASATL